MLKNKKFTFSLLIIFGACLFLLTLNQYSLVLSILLILLAIIKHKYLPIKKEFIWYLLVCFGGAATEALLVNIGGAWSYTTTHIFNIPIWMPLFWGIVGTTIITLYEGFIEK